MSIQTQELLDAAEKIIEKFDEEPFYRIAASSAYYAAYHAAQPMYQDLDKISRGSSGIHRLMIDTFILNPIPKIREIGSLLDLCYSIRKTADYELDENLLEASANESVAFSKRIMEELDKIS